MDIQYFLIESWLLIELIYIFLITGARKTPVTGSVPTETLPEESHEAPKRERRVVVRKPDMTDDDKTSTSPEHRSVKPQYSDIEDFTRQLEKKVRNIFDQMITLDWQSI